MVCYDEQLYRVESKRLTKKRRGDDEVEWKIIADVDYNAVKML